MIKKMPFNHETLSTKTKNVKNQLKIFKYETKHDIKIKRFLNEKYLPQ